jgi:hypothetical protein
MEVVADFQLGLEESDMRVQHLINDFLPCAHSTAPHLKAISIRVLHVFPPEECHQDCALPCQELCQQLGLDIQINQINDHLSPGLWTAN